MPVSNCTKAAGISLHAPNALMPEIAQPARGIGCVDHLRKNRGVFNSHGCALAKVGRHGMRGIPNQQDISRTPNRFVKFFEIVMQQFESSKRIQNRRNRR